jgi:hypothetical protein
VSITATEFDSANSSKKDSYFIKPVINGLWGHAPQLLVIKMKLIHNDYNYRKQNTLINDTTINECATHRNKWKMGIIFINLLKLFASIKQYFHLSSWSSNNQEVMIQYSIEDFARHYNNKVKIWKIVKKKKERKKETCKHSMVEKTHQ